MKNKNKYVVELPPHYAQKICIFGTCSLEVPKNVISHNPHETTLVTGAYFVPSKKLACLFIYDINNNKDMNLLIDDQFLQGLMLNVCVIDNESSYLQSYYGEDDARMQSRFFPSNRETYIFPFNANKIIKFIKGNLNTNENSEKFKNPIFISQLVEDYDSNFEKNVIINIMSNGIVCGFLNREPLNQFQISYHCVSLNLIRK
ncbi:28859_t:CDS:2, partial [Gigaspora margarita]